MSVKRWNVCAPREDKKSGKTFWDKVGAAFPSKGGGIKIVLAPSVSIGDGVMLFPADDRDARPGRGGRGNTRNADGGYRGGRPQTSYEAPPPGDDDIPF